MRSNALAKKNEMRIGISLSPTKSQFGPLLFSGDLYNGINTAKALGYDGVELSLLDSSKIEKGKLLAVLEKQELDVYAIATGQTFYSDGFSLYNHDPDKRARAVERIKGHIELAQILSSYVILGGIRGKIEEATKEGKKAILLQGRNSIKACVEHAEKKSVTLVLEPINRYETNVINNVDEGIHFIREIGSQRVKLVPDTFHMNIEERSIPESIIKAQEYLAYIHFADSNRHAPGWGHINFYEIFSTLKKINFKGPIGVEVLPIDQDYKSARQAIQYIKSLEQYTDQNDKGDSNKR
jgi:sugar phosphate isomerase/epimerase